MNPNDEKVIIAIRSKPKDASAVEIARAFLGPTSRRHQPQALEQIGMSIACRLCGAGRIIATRSNRFAVRE